MPAEASQGQSFRIERHGEIAIIIPSPEVESMHEAVIREAANMVVQSLENDPPSGVVIDLSGVSYFGSVFISFLLRCHMRAKMHGSEIVLAGASDRVQELLRLTALDSIWAIYKTRAEALEMLAAE